MGVLQTTAQTIDPPYGIILDELRSGNATPFLGAAACTSEESILLPSGGELAGILAQDANFPSDDEHDRTDLAKVSSYYVDGSTLYDPKTGLPIATAKTDESGCLVCFSAENTRWISVLPVLRQHTVKYP